MNVLFFILHVYSLTSGYTLTKGQSTPVLISKHDFASVKSITYSGTFANIVGGYKRVVWRLGRE